MSSNMTVGSFVADCSGIYKVQKIAVGADHLGKKCDLLYYRPLKEDGKDYLAHIPLNNIHKIGMRLVISAVEAKKVMAKLSQKPVLTSYDNAEAKETIYQNVLENVVPMLKYLWTNQVSIKRVDRDLMEQMIEQLTRELAFVTNNSAEKVKGSITKQLNK